MVTRISSTKSLQSGCRMKFEVLNDKGITVMQTETKSCIPSEDELAVMNKAGYKFRIDGKNITIRKLIDAIKNEL